MDAATLGLVAAGLVAKNALEAAGDEARETVGESAWGMLGRVADRLRNWFGDRGDDDGLRALDLVEAAPGSELSVKSLATRITSAAGADPDSATDLALLLDAIKAQARPEVATFVDDLHAATHTPRTRAHLRE